MSTNTGRGHVYPVAPGRQIAKPAKQEISNVMELFAALAVDWEEGGANRYLVADMNRYPVRAGGSAFVCTDPLRMHRRFEMEPEDIPVVVRGSGYLMSGFIKFESQYLYRGMFITDEADDRDWYSAKLTAAGFRFAQLGVFDVAGLHEDIARCSFFNPKTIDIVQQQLIEGRPAPEVKS